MIALRHLRTIRPVVIMALWGLCLTASAARPVAANPFALLESFSGQAEQEPAPAPASPTAKVLQPSGTAAPTTSPGMPASSAEGNWQASPKQVVARFSALVDAHQFEQAAELIDFRFFDPAPLPNRKAELAFRLQGVLDRIGRIDVATFPDPAGATRYNVPPGNAVRDVELAIDTNGRWWFSPQTAVRIDDLFRRYSWRSNQNAQDIASLFPRQLHRTVWLLPHYQWIVLVGVFMAGLFAEFGFRTVMAQLFAAWLRLRKSDVDPQHAAMCWKPIGMLVRVGVWYLGVDMVDLAPMVRQMLIWGMTFFALVAAVLTGFRIIDALAGVLKRRSERTKERFDDLLVPMVSKTLKFVTILVAVLMCAEQFKLPITSLLGGLGIGGLAVAIAAQDAIANLFGSLTVLFDRPFEIGDWIKTGDIEGSVEAVGIRSTRIRTVHDSVVSVPNHTLTTACVDNLGRRRHRRFRAVLGLDYNTSADRIDSFCEGVRDLIRQHPATLKDNYQVYLNELAESTLNVLVQCYFQTTDGAVEAAEKHKFLGDILRVAQERGVSFAFPTQTQYVYNYNLDQTGPASEGQAAPEGVGQAVLLNSPAKLAQANRSEPLTMATTPFVSDDSQRTPIRRLAKDAPATERVRRSA